MSLQQNFEQELKVILRALLEHCLNKYGSEPSKTWTAQRLFLQGGSEPLDYIHIYKNSTPKHWHYVGFGLSDIHGYSQYCDLYKKLTKDSDVPQLIDLYPNGKLNGFGFELTMRVKCNSEQEWNDSPPDWPLRLMQLLAKYVVQTRNVFNVGDHIAWYSPLDKSSSKIQHVFFALDPTLRDAKTDSGPVRFIQIVGACSEELQRAQQWGVRGILKMMQQCEKTGGALLVTDMRREETIFDLDSSREEEVVKAIKREGSDMVQFSAAHETSYTVPSWFTSSDRSENIDEDRTIPHQIIDTQEDQPARTPSRMSVGSETALKIENTKLQDIRYYRQMYISLDHRAALILPVMLDGRLAHGRHFSIQSPKGNSTITFVPEGGGMTPFEVFVNREMPIAKLGHWLQIFVPESLRNQMSETIGRDFSCEAQSGPGKKALKVHKNYTWPESHLNLTVKKAS